MTDDGAPPGIKNVTPPEVAAELATSGRGAPSAGSSTADAQGPGTSWSGTPTDGRGGWQRTTWQASGWQGTLWRGSWTPGTPRRTFPWFGLFILLVGVALLLDALDPRLDGAGLVLIAAGIPFLLAWAARRSRLALWPAVILLGYGIARIAVGLGLVQGDGWTTLGVGLGLLIGWSLSALRGGGSRWTLVFAGLFLLFGIVQVSAHAAGLGGIGGVVPAALIIALGAALLASGLRRRA